MSTLATENRNGNVRAWFGRMSTLLPNPYSYIHMTFSALKGKILLNEVLRVWGTERRQFAGNKSFIERAT